MFYEDDIYPEMQVPPAISAIRPEHLYQQQQQQQQQQEQKKSWVPRVIAIDDRW